MTDVKRLLDEATPLPWDPTKPIWDLSTPPTFVKGPNPVADSALIRYAVNSLPDYEAAVDALEALWWAQGSSQDTLEWDAARAVLRRLREGVPA